MNCHRGGKSSRGTRESEQVVKWKVQGANWNNFEQKLASLDYILYGDVDQINEQMVQNINGVARIRVGQRRCVERRLRQTHGGQRKLQGEAT